MLNKTAKYYWFASSSTGLRRESNFTERLRFQISVLPTDPKSTSGIQIKNFTSATTLITPYHTTATPTKNVDSCRYSG